MFPTDIWSWTLYVGLALFLGALGNGFWEVGLKPTITKLSRFILKMLTFGAKSARNSIYREIARRPHHKPSLYLQFLVVIIFSGAMGYGISNYQNSVRPTVENSEIPKMTAEVAAKELKRLEREIKRLEIEIAKGYLLIITPMLFFSFYSWVKNTYVFSAISYFDQLLAICSPYINSKEIDKYKSQFALIQNREDFVNTTDSLREIAKENSIIVVGFIPL